MSVVREHLDQGPITPLMLLVVALGFLLNLVDGIDVVAMSVTAPSLASDWNLERLALGPLFSAALVGMALGASLLSPLADRFGRRILLISAMVLVGLSMLAVHPVSRGGEALTELMLLRFTAGLGIGVIFGSAPALAAEFMPDRYRSLAVSLVVMGYPVGAVLAGPIATSLLPSYGWSAVFVAGGALTLIIAVLAAWLLPESPEFIAAQPGNRSDRTKRVNQLLERLQRPPLASDLNVDVPQRPAIPLNRLLNRSLRLRTVSLWSVYFLGFLTMYFLLSWIPVLFVDSGYSQAQGIQALTGFNLGAVIGIVGIGTLSTRLPLVRLLSAFFLIAGLCFGAITALMPRDLTVLMALIFAGGIFLHGGFTALYALAANVYPSELRASGIGWAAGLGRTGAIVSPVLAAVLVAAGWTMYGLFLVFALPLLIVAAWIWVFDGD